MAGDEMLESLIHDVADWPQPGVGFKDITPLLADPAAFTEVIDRLAGHFIDREVTKVVGIEARGFLIGAPVALRLGAGFVPARKPGKLPRPTETVTYDLEYGTDSLEIHTDAIEPGEQVAIIDDVLATGGTAAAAVELVERLGGNLVGLGFVIELGFLGGAARIAGAAHTSLVTYR
ncbi:MAG: adenine phosphoribosyltransferase [Acidimicrobiia bacterium]|nr:adenine phosphoribosyltransferase [Acidimicrobiia bacterium]